MRWVCLLVVLVIKIHRARLDFDEELNELANDITEKYFKEFKCVIYITDDESKYISNWSRLPPVVKIILTGDTQTLLTEIYDMDCKGFILRVMDRVTVIKNLIRAYKKSNLSRYNNKRYLFLPADGSDNHSSFLEMKDMYYMPYLVFAAPANNSTRFELLEHNYFNGHKYDVLNVKKEVKDIWYPGVGFESGHTLYTDSISNLFGKQMILAMTQYSPYSMIIEEGDSVVYDGLETRIVAQFADYANATWTGKDHPIEMWGDLFENGTVNGILGSVYEHTADFGYGAIYQWHCNVLECSYPYIYAAVTCLVPRPLRVSDWYTIILPFEPSLWGAVFLTYVFSSFTVFFIMVVLHKIRRVNNDEQSLLRVLLESFFSIFRIQLEQSFREAGLNTPLYTLFKICTVYCFFVAVCWQGGISSFLTVPRFEDAIDDAEDLASRWPRMEWGASHISWIKSIRESTQPITAQIARRFLVLDEESLKKRLKLRNFGYFIERLPNGHYGLGKYIEEEWMKYLRIMKDNIYYGNCVIVLPKCSPYLESLDKVLFWMFDTGLIQKLEIQISLERVNNKLQNMVRTSTENVAQEDVALLVSHILGAIFIYGFGIAISSIAFIGEVFYYHTREKKNSVRAFKL